MSSHTESSESTVVGSPGTITWLGHATLLVSTSAGVRVIVDPWIEGNPASPDGLGDLGPLDVIAVTHGHFDHIGSVVPLAAATGARVLCVPELAAYFRSLDVANVDEMNKGGTITLSGLEFTMVSADHSCGVSLPNGGPNIYGGNPVGFVLTLPADEGGPIYVSGDTNVFGDMAIIRELYAPEIAFMPIDGYYNMGPREAALAVTLLGVRRVAPIHYGTFPILTGTPAQLRVRLDERASGAEMIALLPGESLPLRTSAT